MKLKRILSLALAGVLAVSMLAACGGGSTVSGNRISDNTNAVRRAMNTGAGYSEPDHCRL